MAITPNKTQIEAAGLEYIEPTEIVRDTGPKALNLLAQAVVDLMADSGGVDEAEVRAIVEGMDLGGGSGVRAVSGAVTLTTADGPLVQVYATGSATVQGEPLSAGEIAIFRQLGGLWEVRAMNADGTVRDTTWRPPGAPDTRTPVTAEAPTWVDTPETGGGSWTTPAVTGLTYLPASGTATPGQSVTVTAVASAGYRVEGTSSWTHVFPAGPTPGLSANFNVADRTLSSEPYYTDANGKQWRSSSATSVIESQALKPGAAAAVNVTHGVTGDFRLDFTVITNGGELRFAGRAPADFATVTTSDGIAYYALLTPSGSNMLMAIGQRSGTVTYNASGGTAGSTVIPGSTHTGPISVRMEGVGRTLTLYANGTRLLEVLYAEDRATSGGVAWFYSAAGNVIIDDVELVAL